MKNLSHLLMLAAVSGMIFAGCEQSTKNPIVAPQSEQTAIIDLAKSGSGSGSGVRYLDPIFPSVRVNKDIPYSQSIDVDGQMQTHLVDIYEPKNDTAPQRPVIVWLHGGGFTSGDKSGSVLVTLAQEFAKLGYVTASANYRIRPNATDPPPQSILGDPQADIHALVRWLRCTAGSPTPGSECFDVSPGTPQNDFRIDPNLIIVGGWSAGAAIALSVAYDYENMNLNVLNPNTSNPGYDSRSVGVVSIAGWTGNFAQAGDPPASLHHGTADPKVNYNNSVLMAQGAAALGIPYDFQTYQGAGHNLVGFDQNRVVSTTASFLFQALISGPQPPVANAGPDQTVADADGNGAETVTLDGSGSSDPDGTITAYEWKEGATILGTTAIIAPSLSIGAHTITLTVTDNDGRTGSDNVIVTVNANQAPTANAGPDQTVSDVNGDGFETVTLDGSGSSDADGTITAYEWKEGATVLGTTAIISPNLAVGSHSITLTVTDNGGATGSDNVVVNVTQFVNQAPVANAGPDQTVSDTNGDGTETITLDGSSSTDPDGTITAYEWKEGATVLGTTAIISPNLVLGSHTITLTVTDNNGATGSDNVVVTINANQAPTANAGPDQSANVGDNVNFNGSGSNDPDGSIVNYAWNFGDGATASGAVVSHAYTAAGTYTATLTVTDNGGLTAQDVAIVTISNVPSDVVNIIKAEWNKDKRKLKVEATSTMSPNAVLTVVGFGTMQYNAKKDKYKLNVSNITSNPGTVTVTSSLGGSDTATVKVK